MKFLFDNDYVLENEVVRLSPLESANFEDLLEFSIHEPELWTYSLVQGSSPEKLKAYIEKAIDGRTAKNSYAFVVFDKRSQEFAGSTRFYDMQLQNQTLQLGFTWYGKKFQGTGLNKHCKLLLLQFAFEELKMQRVEFRADNDNIRSINAMKSIGCQEEGVLRSNLPTPNGQRRDSIVLSILQSEWPDVRRRIEAQLAR